MGFLDKVKEQAGSLANSVNETVSKGQQSMDEGQSRKRADGLLRDLGALVYARDTGRGTEATDAAITRLTAELQDHEAQGGVVDLSDHTQAPAPEEGTPPPPPGAGTTPPPPPGGDAAATAPPPAPAAPSAPTVTPPPPPGSVAPPPAPGSITPPPPPGTVS